QLKRLGYVLPQDLSVGLILNGLTSDFTGFVRNYNMHNMWKTIGELHAMLIEYERGLPKKAETPQVMMIKGDFEISVSKNSVFYFNVIPSNGIYEVDIHDLVPNVNSIYNVSTKRAKHNLDSTYLWHCRLAHISKKHIEKLQHEGLLKSTDDESFDQGNRFHIVLKGPTDLLGIIHTDACGPLRHVSRQGASYFITFTDDYSRYGYVYLLKHKHEEKSYIVRHGSIYDESYNSAVILLGLCSRVCNTHSQYGLTKKVDKTPYELWYGKDPNLSYLKVWGCEALVKPDMPEKHQQRSVKCIFICYSKETMGYYFYFPTENKTVGVRYAEFFKKNLITQEISEGAIDLEEIQDEDTSPSEITSKIPMEVEGFKPPQEEVILIRSYKDVMLDSESNKWIDASNAQIQSMIDNMVWVLVDLPPSCKTVGSKWIFKKKTNRMEETFSPVGDIRAIRILISIAVFYDYEICFVDPNHPRKVCKLQRSIYGLKQASRSWNERFDEEIKRFGYDQHLDEPCVYQKANGSSVAKIASR
nr:hypothetical protein [Tanacetum cinerariifolium]